MHAQEGSTLVCVNVDVYVCMFAYVRAHLCSQACIACMQPGGHLCCGQGVHLNVNSIGTDSSYQRSHMLF